MSNGPSTSSSSSSTSTGNNRLSIAMFILIGLFPFYWFFSKSHLPNLAAPEGPADFTPGASDWYLTVKMPEAPFDSVGMEAYKKTLSAWLAGLQRVGFHPILLSDVYSHANHNAGLPDKAVVLTFEPGYAHTYELAAPILSWYKTPAVWITNTAAIKRSNRKYVSNFRIWRMKHSGQWDVGSYDSPGVLTIQAKQNGKMAFGSASQPTWVTGGKMSYAINQRKAPNRMNRLKTNFCYA